MSTSNSEAEARRRLRRNTEHMERLNAIFGDGRYVMPETGVRVGYRFRDMAGGVYEVYAITRTEDGHTAHIARALSTRISEDRQHHHEMPVRRIGLYADMCEHHNRCVDRAYERLH